MIVHHLFNDYSAFMFKQPGKRLRLNINRLDNDPVEIKDNGLNHQNLLFTGIKHNQLHKVLYNFYLLCLLKWEQVECKVQVLQKFRVGAGEVFQKKDVLTFLFPSLFLGLNEI